MYEEERKIEEPDKTVKIVEDIFKLNKQNQEGKGLNILTPNQMLSWLPITLAQLKAGNNSEKLQKKSDNYCILFIVQKICLNKCPII